MKSVRYIGRNRRLRGATAIVQEEGQMHLWVQFDCTALTRFQGGPLLGFDRHRFKRSDFEDKYPVNPSV